MGGILSTIELIVNKGKRSHPKVRLILPSLLSYFFINERGTGDRMGMHTIRKGGLIGICFFCFICQLFPKDATIDSLKQVLITSKSDSIKYKVSRQIGDAYYEDNIDSLLLYYTKALVFAEKRADIRGQISTLRSLGYSFTNRASNYEQATIYFEKAHQLATLEKDTVAQTYILSDFGVLYWNRGRNLQAIEYHFQAHQLAKQLNHQALIMKTQLSLGVLYNEEKDNATAIDCYQVALPIADSLKRENVKGVLLNNLGKAYRDMEKYDSAALYFDKALAIFNKLADNNWKTLVYYNIAKNHQELGQYTQAISFYQQAYELNKIMDNRSRAAMILADFAATYQAIGNFEVAITKAQAGLIVLQDIDTRLYHAPLNKTIAESYIKQGRHDLALKHYQAYMVAKDSLEERQKSEKLAEFTQLYESEKKKVEIAQLKTQNAAKQIQLNNSNNWIRLLAGSCLFLSASFIAWFFYHKNKALEIRKQLRVQLTHDLHDNINSSLNHIKFIAGRLSRESYSPEEKKNNLRRIRTISNELVNNMHDLIWTLDDKKEKLEDLIDKMEDHASNVFASINAPYYIDSSIEMPNKTLKTTVKNNIYAIYKEAINNIIKHTEPEAVEINFSVKGGFFYMNIKNDTRIVKKATHSSNIGLKSMHKRTTDINGQLQIEAAAEKFVLSLSVPI